MQIDMDPEEGIVEDQQQQQPQQPESNFVVENPTLVRFIISIIIISC